MATKETGAAIADKKKKASAGKTKTASGSKKNKKTSAAKQLSPFGNFGKLISFTTSDKKILTFRDFKRENSARWKEHALIGRLPRMQFLGPGRGTITFSIVLDARHGVKPRSTIDEILAYENSGKADYLVINGEKVCSNKLIITKSSDTWDEVWNRGELVRATLELTLEEYV